MTKLRFSFTALALLSVALVEQQAFAYLNPNIGSMLIQGLIAGIAVVTVTVRIYWYRLVAFFKGEKFEVEDDLLAVLNANQAEDSAGEQEDKAE